MVFMNVYILFIATVICTLRIYSNCNKEPCISRPGTVKARHQGMELWRPAIKTWNCEGPPSSSLDSWENNWCIFENFCYLEMFSKPSVWLLLSGCFSLVASVWLLLSGCFCLVSVVSMISSNKCMHFTECKNFQLSWFTKWYEGKCATMTAYLIFNVLYDVTSCGTGQKYILSLAEKLSTPSPIWIRLYKYVTLKI